MSTDAKQKIVSMLRKIGLIIWVDKALFTYSKFINRKVNNSFVAEHPTIALPPDYMMYESFQVNYSSYYFDSLESAKYILDRARPYLALDKARILDWGCGPGRIIRHMPSLLANSLYLSLCGTDYNKGSIQWCKDNIEGVNFSVNGLSPPLAYDSESFDFIYGISIFTHLSEEMHKKWLDELYRVMAKGAILYLTSHGDSFRKKLTRDERNKYDRGKIVVRGKTHEGHRSFVAFQSPEYFKSLLSNFEILEFIAGDRLSKKAQQDEWILRKN